MQEKREEYQRSLKEAEDREIQEKKIKAREQVIFSYLLTVLTCVHCMYVCTLAVNVGI